MAFNLGGSASGGKRGRGIPPTMNVTPLVDVVLVLLIIFMVVTPMLTKHLTADVPQKPREDTPAPPPGERPLPPIVVQLRADGKLAVNREEMNRDVLVANVQRMLNARPDKVVFFDAADQAPYASAVEVLDELRGGGISMIAVLPDHLP